jgi:hypothetical protein
VRRRRHQYGLGAEKQFLLLYHREERRLLLLMLIRLKAEGGLSFFTPGTDI